MYLAVGTWKFALRSKAQGGLEAGGLSVNEKFLPEPVVSGPEAVRLGPEEASQPSGRCPPSSCPGSGPWRDGFARSGKYRLLKELAEQQEDDWRQELATVGQTYIL